MRLCHVKRPTLAQQPILHMTSEFDSREKLLRITSCLMCQGDTVRYHRICSIYIR